MFCVIYNKTCLDIYRRIHMCYIPGKLMSVPKLEHKHVYSMVGTLNYL